MKIMITSGGTSEKIDEVRRITNMSTGRLGVAIAEEFALKKADITYICGLNALIPKGGNIDVVRIGSANELKDAITTHLSAYKYDAVIHAMAVSDYTVSSTISSIDLAAAIAEDLCRNKENLHSQSDLEHLISDVMDKIVLPEKNTKKLSSSIDRLMLLMGKTPKIIKIIKELQPETLLVGFKLLVGVSQEELLQVAHNLLVKNNCDFVLANDLERITGERHEAILVRPDASFAQMQTKQEIAEVIVNNISALI